MECLYCGASKPKVKVLRWKGFQTRILNESFDLERRQGLTIGAVRVDCPNRSCDKRYLFLGKPSDPKTFASQILYGDGVVPGFDKYHLRSDDIVRGMIGVAVPTFYQRKSILRHEVHLVFEAKGNRYYLSCFEVGGSLRAIEVEKLWRIK